MTDINYQLYVLAELSYKQEHPDKTDAELFPIEWTACTNYKLKSDIIAKAINNKVLIEDVPEYLDTIERVVRE